VTERLSTLLHEEAAGLDVPAPAHLAVLARGRRLRRRRRATSGVAGLALLALVGSGAVLGVRALDHDGTRTVEPAGPAYLHGGAFAVGSTIHFGDRGDHVADVEGRVKALYYTSAGVLVRTGTDAFTDSAGPSHYDLVTPDGEVSTLDLDLGDRVPATDPDQPYLAYAQKDGSGWAVVVRDVRTDAERSRTHLDGAFTWGGWEAPPVSLSGDSVYVGLDDGAPAVDWRTGEVTTAALPGRSSAPTVAGGHTVVADRREVRVIDVATGDILLSVPNRHFPYVDLSPDGRYAKVVLQDDPAEIERPYLGEQDGFLVQDLATGERATVESPAFSEGWTPDGHLLRVGRRSVTTCAPMSGQCETTTGELGGGRIKLGGLSYES
jgi:hypothetical protein